MKLKELLAVCGGYDRVELHSSYDGRIVASTRKGMEKYGEVDVMRFHPCLKASADGSLAVPYVYIYGNSYQIGEVKKNA